LWCLVQLLGLYSKIDGVSYGSYIVPGLLMLTLLTQSISNTSFGIFFQNLMEPLTRF